MHQTLENVQKLNFGPDFGLFDPNLGPQIFFGRIYLRNYSKLSPYAI